MWDKDEFDADGAPPRCPMCGEYDCDCMRRLEFESEQKTVARKFGINK